MMKRLLSLVLALVMVLGAFSFVYAEGETTPATGNETPAEVKGPEVNKKIQWLIDQSLVKGYGDGNYGLEKNISRAEIAAMIVRAKGLESQAEASKGATRFSDVPATHWASGYINIASGAGYINGYPNGKFGPADNITAQDVVVMLVRAYAANLKNVDVKALSYPYGYINAAAENGMLDGLTGNVAYPELAIRQNAFEIVYNAMHDVAKGKFGRNVTFKAIVARNSRTEQVPEREVIFRILEVPDRDKISDTTKLNRETYRANQTIRLTLPEKYDADSVLGRVYDVSLDKDGKVTLLEEDKTYEVKYGKVTAADSDKFGINKTNYTVAYKRNYQSDYSAYDRERDNEAVDTRITDTFVNNKDFRYMDTLKLWDTARSFARVTVKNGMVFFIDGYRFDDIAPYKELKDEDTMLAYDDGRDGRVEPFDTTTAVIGYTAEKGFYRLAVKDIKDTDVIHQYFEDVSAAAWDQCGYIVKQDAKYDGKYDRVHRNQEDGRYARVTGTTKKTPDFPMYNGKLPFKGVYSYDGKQFRTLFSGNDQEVLRNLEGKDVTVLTDLFGRLQSIYGNVVFNQGTVIVDNALAYSTRVVKKDGSRLDLDSNLDTNIRYYDADKDEDLRPTSHQRMQNLNRGDLVYIDAPEKGFMNQLIKLKDYRKMQSKKYAIDVKKSGNAWDMNNNYIRLDNGMKYQVLGRTNVFVAELNKNAPVSDDDKKEVKVDVKENIYKVYRVRATTVSGVKSTVVKPDKNNLRAYVVTDKMFRGLIDAKVLRYYDWYYVDKDADAAHTIVFLNMEEKFEYDDKYILTKDKDTGMSVSEVTDQDNKTYTVPSTEYNKYQDLTDVKKGDVLYIEYEKEVIKRYKIASVYADEDTFKVVKGENDKFNYNYDDRDARRITLEDKNGVKKPYWIKKGADRFIYPVDRTYKILPDDIVRIVVDGDTLNDKAPEIDVIVVDQYREVPKGEHKGATVVDKDVDNVKALINALPATITLADKTNIEAARDAYTALGAKQKDVPADVLAKLVAAEKALAALMPTPAITVEAEVTKNMLSDKWTVRVKPSDSTAVVNKIIFDGVEHDVNVVKEGWTYLKTTVDTKPATDIQVKLTVGTVQSTIKATVTVK